MRYVKLAVDIREKRLKEGLSQLDLAKLVNCPHYMIESIEEVGGYTFDCIKELVKWLGKTIEDYQ